MTTAEFKHQKRHSEAITLLNGLESQRRELVARQEQQIAELKYNISQLRSENNYLRTALSVPSPDSLAPSNNLAHELQLMTRHAQRLGLRTDGRPMVHELGGLGRILCDIWCLENLEIFLEGEPRQKPGGVYCLGYIGSGGCYPRFKLSGDGLLHCPYHVGGISGGCVWIMKDEVGWVIGSVPPRPTSGENKH